MVTTATAGAHLSVGRGRSSGHARGCRGAPGGGTALASRRWPDPPRAARDRPSTVPPALGGGRRARERAKSPHDDRAVPGCRTSVRRDPCGPPRAPQLSTSGARPSTDHGPGPPRPIRVSVNHGRTGAAALSACAPAPAGRAAAHGRRCGRVGRHRRADGPLASAAGTAGCSGVGRAARPLRAATRRPARSARFVARSGRRSRRCCRRWCGTQAVVRSASDRRPRERADALRPSTCRVLRPLPRGPAGPRRRTARPTRPPSRPPDAPADARTRPAGGAPAPRPVPPAPPVRASPRRARATPGRCCRRPRW